MDTWDDLRVLLEVSRDHSLSATAARLKTSHTTLSRRLAALEQSLSARLVERTGAGVTMTRLGKELVARAQQMETAALDAERWVSGDDQRLEGRVRLSTTEAFAQHLLFPSLRVFQDAYPAIELEVLVGNTQVDLSKGEADVAIRAAPTKTPSLVAKRVATLAVGLYVSNDYARRKGPLETEGFKGHEVVGYLAEARGFPESQWLSTHAAQARVSLRQSSVLGILAAVNAGLGLGLVPCFLGDADRSLRRVGALDAALQRGIWVVADRRVHRAARVRVLTEYISKMLASKRALLAGKSAGAAT